MKNWTEQASFDFLRGVLNTLPPRFTNHATIQLRSYPQIYAALADVQFLKKLTEILKNDGWSEIQFSLSEWTLTARDKQFFRTLD